MEAQRLIPRGLLPAVRRHHTCGEGCDCGREKAIEAERARALARDQEGRGEKREFGSTSAPSSIGLRTCCLHLR